MAIAQTDFTFAIPRSPSFFVCYPNIADIAVELFRMAMLMVENELGAEIAALPRRAGRPSSRRIGKTA